MSVQAILTRKIGMTQLFADEGERFPVTVLKFGDMVVLQKKERKSEGYEAVQVGFEELDGRRVRTKAELGHFKKANAGCFRVVKEFRVEDSTQFQVGQKISVDFVKVGDVVSLTGVSKGKGFQGVMKRHHFAGHCSSHGATIHRRPGSIGMRERPGRVLKNKRMPGHMGVDRVTVRNIKVIAIDKEKQVLMVKGAAPGGKNGLVIVRLQIKRKTQA